MRGNARAAAASALLLVAACGPSGPGDDLAPGTLLVGRSAGVTPVLESVERLRGTPLAQAAAAARERIADCRVFGAHCPPESECRLADAVSCEPDSAPLRAAVEALGDRDWLFAESRGEEFWARASGGRAADGTVVATVELAGSRPEGALSLLLPGGKEPGPRVLASEGVLAHVRLRPDGGLDVASLVPGEGFGARLFKLQSELFAGAVLAGVWELAVYQPEQGQRIPPVALAVDFKNRASAVKVMESFLDDVQQQWPVRRSPLALGGWEGECLGNLRVLPDLAPCYLATDRALVIGWNSYSLGVALAGGGTGEGDGVELRIDFDRLPTADARLALATGAPAGAEIEYPFGQALVDGRRESGRYRFELRLTSRAAAP